MRSRKIDTIIERLTAVYGRQVQRHREGPVDVLVRTILSQNTSDVNSDRAYELLRERFPSWEKVAEASPDKIAEAIKTGGLNEVKAVYIKTALNEIKKDRGVITLDFLGEMPVDVARGWLTKLPGVGIKTASCVLVFAMGMPALPVDTHIKRVTGRLGLIKPELSLEKAHYALEQIVLPEQVYEFHLLVIEHGRRTCKSQRPLCRNCALADMCPSYPVYIRND